MLDDAPSLRGRMTLAAVLNYQLKKMDLTPDWMPELGMVDDAMALRTGAAVFRINNMEQLAPEHEALIARLEAEDATVKAIMGEERYEKFFRLVRDLIDRPVKGREPETILEDDALRRRFLKEVEGHVERFRPPATPDPRRFYERLQSHLKAKLK
jgi:uncharacterized membrane protein YkvA (DUF1232 family)